MEQFTFEYAEDLTITKKEKPIFFVIFVINLL